VFTEGDDCKPESMLLVEAESMERVRFVDELNLYMYLSDLYMLMFRLTAQLIEHLRSSVPHEALY